MRRQSLVFVAPGRVEVQESDLPAPPRGQVLVRTRLSAVSAGTERLIYRGQFPADLPLDATLPDLRRPFAYPLTYGYALVGTVEAVGEGVEEAWLGRRVFAFHPHESAFLADPAGLVPLPESLAWEEALFLPNLETALSLVHDGAPLAGERVAVVGLGVVGLLTTALLARFPLEALVALDPLPRRRERALAFGAQAAFHPDDLEAARGALAGGGEDEGADLVFEVSGNPAALQTAIDLCGFQSRVVVGSWYGRKEATLDLGRRFHRDRLRLISSQVSHLPPHLTGRWTKGRRLAFALKVLAEVHPANLITHRFPLERAAEVYHLLDRQPEAALQVVFTYDADTV